MAQPGRWSVGVGCLVGWLSNWAGSKWCKMAQRAWLSWCLFRTLPVEFCVHPNSILCMVCLQRTGQLNVQLLHGPDLVGGEPAGWDRPGSESQWTNHAHSELRWPKWHSNFWLSHWKKKGTNFDRPKHGLFFLFACTTLDFLGFTIVLLDPKSDLSVMLLCQLKGKVRTQNAMLFTVTETINKQVCSTSIWFAKDFNIMSSLLLPWFSLSHVWIKGILLNLAGD